MSWAEGREKRGYILDTRRKGVSFFKEYEGGEQVSVESERSTRQLLEDGGFADFDGFSGAILGVDGDGADAFEDLHALVDAAKDGVLLIEMRGRCEGQEELARVAVRPAVRHRQNPCPREPQFRMLTISSSNLSP